ncbi:MAG: sugar phosphate isomerase/epimerase [Epulopiscium sp.]|nr:sugar phosphate isomerase/epimerase [Candidatus Epulonipiscium sp.]
MKTPISVQLHTVRTELKEDFIGTLKKVKEIGYEAVEFAGYGGLEAEELKKELDLIGLTVSGSHVSMEKLQNHLEEEIEYNKILGNTYLICPWLKWKDEKDCLALAGQLNEIGKKVKEAGLQLGYHNHAHELELLDEKIGFDVFLEAMDPENVQLELDTYWLHYGGVDPISYIKQYAQRCKLIHIKDMQAGDGKEFAAIGEGVMDIPAIVQAGKEIGVKWFVVENDDPKPNGITNISLSMENLQKMNII